MLSKEPVYRPQIEDVEDKTILEKDVIIKNIQNSLIDIKRDIDLNYKRIYFRNPAIRVMLIMMQSVLESWIEMLNFPESDDLERPKSKFTFGTDVKDMHD